MLLFLNTHFFNQSTVSVPIIQHCFLANYSNPCYSSTGNFSFINVYTLPTDEKLLFLLSGSKRMLQKVFDDAIGRSYIPQHSLRWILTMWRTSEYAYSSKCL